MNGYSLTVLVDTGVSWSVLDITMWCRICVPGWRLSAEDASSAGANGQPLKVYRDVDTAFELQDWKFVQRFQVVDTGHFVDGLLGLDFLIAVAAKIDLGKMTQFFLAPYSGSS